ncbi:MAG: DUF1214 domain-containing protein [Myxococcota bacterium]
MLGLLSGVACGTMAFAARLGFDLRRALGRHVVHHPHGWRAIVGVGTEHTHPRVRAMAAPAYPLPEQHAIYLFANNPEQPHARFGELLRGRPMFRLLPGDGHFRVSGTVGELQCAWWSLTAYDAEGRPMSEDQSECSLLDRDLKGPDGAFEIDVCATRPRPPAPGRRWLRVRPGEPFQLVLRVYEAQHDGDVAQWPVPLIQHAQGGPAC